MTRVEAAVRIHLPRDDVYQAWHDLQRLPRLISQIEDVEVLPDGDSRWTVREPAGPARWHAETLADDPGHRIAWRTVGDADVRHHGEVTFQCVGNGRTTEVRLALACDRPPGAHGHAAGGRLGVPAEDQAAEWLEDFKRGLEAGRPQHPR
ncbi:MAG TPA: SRPBCC family protein [Longimicrobiales bacterium]|nr:SRPBCC family protein [Longimicrobiales bacterium]